MMREDNITIPRHVYDALVVDQTLLQALESAGVDNWDGYEYAMELFREDMENK